MRFSFAKIWANECNRDFSPIVSGFRLLRGDVYYSERPNCSLGRFALRVKAHSLFDDVREVVSNLLVACPANKQSVDSAEIAVVLVLRLRLLADSDSSPSYKSTRRISTRILRDSYLSMATLGSAKRKHSTHKKCS